MPRTIRFHLDENCAGAIATGLRRHGIDVTSTPEVGLLGAPDPEESKPLLAFAVCYVTAHLDLDLVDEQKAEAILNYCEEHLEER
jgi:hypothetical protein